MFKEPKKKKKNPSPCPSREDFLLYNNAVYMIFHSFSILFENNISGGELVEDVFGLLVFVVR